MSIGLMRGELPPTEDGYYILDASKAEGWTGPSGDVEIVTHTNNGKPWVWCYWLPNSKGKRARCGIPLSCMRGARWIGPLQLSIKP